ncbi:MAG: cysteine hydrolase [Actinobacteria bacterium]|nr:cysteine hydrolase [Actinomycetota bacterium]
MEEWMMQGKPALILIHMQHAITDPEGTVAHLHAKATWESGIIPKQQALLKAFREKDMPVIYVNSMHPVDAAEKMSPYGRFYNVIRNSRVNEPGTKDVEVLSAVADLPGEPVIGNFMFGIFSGNTGGDLGQILADAGADVLVLCGVATGMAVMTAVVQAADMFYKVIVPSDASIDGNQAIHDVAMKMIIPAMALVTTTEDVIAHL